MIVQGLRSSLTEVLLETRRMRLISGGCPRSAATSEIALSYFNFRSAKSLLDESASSRRRSKKAVKIRR